MHVGNLRTMLLCRHAANYVGAPMVVRIDDNDKAYPEAVTRLHDHMLRSIDAAEVQYEELYTWTSHVPAAMRLIAESMTPEIIQDILRHPGHILLQELLSVAMEQTDGITHAVRGLDLAGCVVREQWTVDKVPGWRMVCSFFVPIVTWHGEPIHKSGLGSEVETEVSVLQAVARYGAEPLTAALLASCPRTLAPESVWPEQADEYVNDWDEIKARWLE